MTSKPHLNAPPTALDLSRPLRILHLDSSQECRLRLRGWLQQQDFAAEITDAQTGADFVKSLDQKPFDIILSDKGVQGFTGLAALHFVRERFPQIPFVFVTGNMGEEGAVDAIKEGATDYVLKSRLTRLIPAIQRAIRESERAAKTRQAEARTRQQAALLDKARDAIIVKDIEDHVLYWNKSAERIYGWAAADIIGRKAGELLPEDLSKCGEARKSLVDTGSWTGELTTLSGNGQRIIVESRWTLVRDASGNPESVFIIDTDITEKKQLELQLLRSQRIDTIGTLAGGIAHDLNNALAPVLMGAEILRTCDDQSNRETYLDIISSGTERALALVKQILSFARGPGGHAGPVKLRQVIQEMGNLIRETFPKSISIAVDIPGDELWTVHGDATEFHQVLLNLCVNARDAMPKGGRLQLSAQNVTLDKEPGGGDKASGPYVTISVADNGSGIRAEFLPHIFEPFFTTKIGDKGTGLGLPTVAGIVKRHGGFVEVKTEPGKGTEFKVCIPAFSGAEETAEEPRAVALPMGHGELILVIDDEEAVREFTKTMLESYGYRVVTAQNGVQGIDRFKEYKNEIRLLVTDIDMPYVDGMGAIRAIKELKPEVPVIIASGSERDAEQLRRTDIVHLNTLEKPFGLDQLLIAVGSAIKAPEPIGDCDRLGNAEPLKEQQR